MKRFSRYWNGDERDSYSNRNSDPRKEESKKWLADCSSIVDLGCGTGRDVLKWQNEGKDAWGVTYQTKEHEDAQKRGAQVVLADLHELPFEDNRFDGMFMYDALEHCVSPYIALCEARRVVKHKGRGVIFIPGQKWIETKYHILVPTQRQMKWLLLQSGWHLHHLDDWSHRQEEMALYYLMNLRSD